VALLEGDVDWKAVHQAFADIDYRGTATLELAGGDAEYIKEVSRRFDRILDGV
jgi:hexulose-6-phosphate isomerase